MAEGPIEIRIRPTPATDDAPADVVLRAVRTCASSWAPEARLLGNVRAGDIVRAITDVLQAAGRAGRDLRHASAIEALTWTAAANLARGTGVTRHLADTPTRMAEHIARQLESEAAAARLSTAGAATLAGTRVTLDSCDPANVQWLMDEFEQCRASVDRFNAEDPPRGTGARVYQAVARIVDRALSARKALELAAQAFDDRARCPNCDSCRSTAELMRDHLRLALDGRR